jgi:cation diffusion facilitator CzcD-associated flavoprotein CzcO
MTKAENRHRIIIVGAGFSGLCMGMQLQRNNFHDFIIIEKGNTVGGTWWENKYPGAECDVESHLYSFSFEPNPDWSRAYSGSDEIYQYLHNCAKKYDLMKHIHFDEIVTECTFEVDREWRVKTAKGVYTSQFVVFSSSPLHYAVFPDIPGIQEFKGKVLHTSQWDLTYDFSGKKIGMIGCAASGIQCLPHLQRKCKEVVVYQRTPQWILPKGNRTFWGIEKFMFRWFPCLMKFYRSFLYKYHEMFWNTWYKGSIMNSLTGWLGRTYIKWTISNPDLRKKLLPSYLPGCKRILVSDDFYQHLNKPNVTFLNNVVKMSSTSMIDKEGQEYPIDALVLATGFDVTGGVNSVKFIDKTLPATGVEPAPVYEEYYGVYLKYYKNFFSLLGFNSGSTYTSVLLYMESQVKHVLEVIKYMNAHHKKTIQINPKSFHSFNSEVQAKTKPLVFDTCKSWYVRDGKNIAVYPDSVTKFDYNLHHVKFDDHFIFE